MSARDDHRMLVQMAEKYGGLMPHHVTRALDEIDRLRDEVDDLVSALALNGINAQDYRS
jgi:hypothetical protein